MFTAPEVRAAFNRFLGLGKPSPQRLRLVRPREVTIRFSQWKNYSLSICSAAMTIAIIVSLASNHLHSTGKPFSFGLLLAVILFPTGAIICLRNALDRSPKVIIFKGGVSIQRGKRLYIPWSEIKSCRSVTSRGYSGLFILVRGDFDVPVKTPLLLRPLFALERRFVGPSIGFSTSGYDMSHSMIRETIEEWIAFKAHHP